VDAVKSLTEDVSQNVKSTVDVANSDAVGQQQTTVAAVYEQPGCRNKRLVWNWYEQLSGKTKPLLTRDWKQVAQALGKSDAYINRIAAVTESGQPLPEPARTAMEQDFSAYKQISIELWQYIRQPKPWVKMKLIWKQIA